MDETEEIVMVKLKVYKAVLEILQVSAQEKEDPKYLVERIVSECRGDRDDQSANFWSEVQTFLKTTGVSKVSDLLAIEKIQQAYILH